MAVDKEVEFSKENQQGGKSKAGGFSKFLWNSETKEFLGRNGKSWALIGVYYFIFYICLAGFFAINLLVFFTGISSTAPKLQKKDTLLKGYPGMGFRPMVDSDNTLIAYRQGVENERNNKTIQEIENFLAPYSIENQNDEKYVHCEPNTNRTDGKLCRFNLDHLEACAHKDSKYGYDHGKPCVYLKLNKIYDWEPAPLKNETCYGENSDPSCPKNLALDYIGVTCEGETAADQQYMGEIKIYPTNGFPHSFYPYLNQKGYLAPLVAVQFQRPKPGALLMIWCKAWAGNIYHHKNDRAGSVHFELLVD